MDQEEMRQRAIKDYLSGEASLRTLGERYKCPHTRIYRWIMAHKKQTTKRALLNPGPVKTPLPEQDSMSTDVGSLQEEVQMLKIRILLLEATIDISDEQFGTSMRKKVGTRQS
jgi:transposase-like protein